ncbi:hypothetical protein D3C76_1334170 [compost metagenome]
MEEPIIIMSMAKIICPMLQPKFRPRILATISTPPVVPPKRNTSPSPVPSVTPAYSAARIKSCSVLKGIIHPAVIIRSKTHRKKVNAPIPTPVYTICRPPRTFQPSRNKGRLISSVDKKMGILKA